MEQTAKAGRLDQILVAQGLAPSRSRASDAIARGCVRVDGAVVKKPGILVSGGAAIEVDDPAASYVSRAALKLIRALDAFELDPAGRTCLDIGASTGGFTQVLLERGAARVFAVDVGHGQLHEHLARDPRVVAMEGVNARFLTRAEIPEPAEAIVADVSFIGLKLVLSAALKLAAPDCILAALVKPQYELGQGALGKGGVVRDPALARQAAEALGEWVTAQPGWHMIGIAPSPLKGGDGNAEYLIGARREG